MKVWAGRRLSSELQLQELQQGGGHLGVRRRPTGCAGTTRLRELYQAVPAVIRQLWRAAKFKVDAERTNRRGTTAAPCACLWSEPHPPLSHNVWMLGGPTPY